MANGNETKDFSLTLDFAKRLAMMTRTEKGEQARQYFIECEKQLKEQNKRLLPAIYKAALIELVHQIEINEQQQLTIEKQADTIDNLATALDSLLEWVSIIKVAKHNNIREKEFNWRRLKAQSENMGFVIKKAASPRFGYQNLYHINVFKSCYPEYNYNLLDD
jgi:paraquat-inducible protein B